MKILNKEIDFSFTNADEIEKLEVAIEKTQNKFAKIDVNNMKQSEVVRETYNLIKECFDYTFGDGITEEIMGGATDFRLCVKAFKDLINAKKEQDKQLDDEINELKEITDTYSPNRATRRVKK